MKRVLNSGCAFSLAAFVLIAAGCRDRTGQSAKDAQMRRIIAGTWVMETNRVEGIITLNLDGSCSGYWSNTVTPRGWRSEGEWEIINGDCVMTTTNKTSWNLALHGPPGTTERIRIMSLDDQELITVSDDQTNKWSRKK